MKYWMGKSDERELKKVSDEKINWKKVKIKKKFIFDCDEPYLYSCRCWEPNGAGNEFL